jgi:hypothetical protein
LFVTLPKRAKNANVSGSVTGRLLVLALSSCGAVTATASEFAYWRPQSIDFEYRGHATQYDCAVLTNKVAGVLRAVGAHALTRVEPMTCATSRAGDAPIQFASFRIDVVSPARFTSKAQADVSSLATKAELLKRIGVTAPPLDPFRVAWTVVDVARDRHLRIGREDCELVAQLSSQVLSKLEVDVVSRTRVCSGKRSPVLKVRAMFPESVASVGQLPRRVSTDVFGIQQ